MPEISFGLIRRLNPDIDVDNIESVEIIKLESSGITEIDDLELFSGNLKELYLSGNKIALIENLLFFDKLKHLDLSCNRITSDGLRKSIHSFPKKLESVNLSGNPCAEDDEVLGDLQDAHPELGIVIEIVDANEEDDFNHEEMARDPIVSGAAAAASSDEEGDPHRSRSPVDADEIIKYIVDRKCKAQTFATFNLASTIEDLNIELSKALAISDEKLHLKQANFEAKRLSTDKENKSFEEKYISRKDELMNRNKFKDTSQFDAFMSRLKSTARSRLENISRQHEGDTTAAPAVANSGTAAASNAATCYASGRKEFPITKSSISSVDTNGSL